MDILPTDQIEKLLKELPLNWAVISGTALQTTFAFDSFSAGLVYVNKVAAAAEEMQHHPDIELSYGSVVISITTHDQNGLTKKDFELAEKISQISV